MNKVMLLGNLGKDPREIKTATGTTMAAFTLATHEKFKKDGNWEEKTDWHDVVTFGTLADTVLKHLKSGSRVLVQGKLSTRVKEQESGQKERHVEVKADEVTFL